MKRNRKLKEVLLDGKRHFRPQTTQVALVSQDSEQPKTPLTDQSRNT
jgi:hypothetical protein